MTRSLLMIALPALTILSGCLENAGPTEPDSLEVGGLTLDPVYGTFSGLPRLGLNDVPTVGAATYVGRYIGAEAHITPTSSGAVIVGVDFAGKEVALELEGALIGAATGTLDQDVFGNATFSGGDGSEFHFSGGIYGSEAEAVAGEFYSTYCPPNLVCAAVIIPGYFAAAKE